MVTWTRTWRRTMVLSLLLAGCAVDELAPPGEDDTAEPPSLPSRAIGEAPTLPVRPGGAPPPDHPANVQGVTVEVHDWVIPTWPLRAGARVLFLRPDGTIDSETTTDASGRATGGLPGDGTVVTINDRQITSFIGAEPLDLLVSGQPSGAFGSTPSGGVVLPIAPVATRWYAVVGDCVGGFSTTPEVPLRLGPGCAAGPRELMAKVYTTSLVFHYLPIGQVMVGPGVTTTVGGTWQSASPFTLRYGGVPADTFITVGTEALAGQYTIGYALVALGAPVDGVVSSTVAHPPAMGDATRVSTYVIDASTTARQIITTLLPGYRTDHAIADVSGELLPWVTAITSGGVTGASWTVAPGGRPADGVIVHFQGQRDAPRDVWDWRVIGPADLRSVSLPPVPGWGSFDRLFVHVQLVEAPQVTSMRELFRHAFSISSYIGAPLQAGTRYESGVYRWF